MNINNTKSNAVKNIDDIATELQLDSKWQHKRVY